MKRMKLLFVIALFSVYGINSQTEWGCNHYSVYPVDTCISYSSSIDYFYQCNGTDIMNFISYDGGDCGNGDPTNILYLDLTSDVYSDIAECDNEDSCGYFSVNCDDTSELFVAVDVCYSASSSLSNEYYCDGSELITVVYSNSDDCTGSSVSATIDYTTYYTGDCTVMLLFFFFIFFSFF